MLTSRDHEVIEFVKTFKIARTDTIKELFFPSLSACQKRLKSIYEQKELYRVRDVLTKDYLYYLSKPTQLKHSLLLTDFYRELHKRADIIHFGNEANLGSIRPDALIAYRHNGKDYLACVEIEISRKGLDLDKYVEFFRSGDYRKYFPVFPRLFIVSDYKVSVESELVIQQIKTDLATLPL